MYCEVSTGTKKNNEITLSLLKTMFTVKKEKPQILFLFWDIIKKK